MPGSLPRPLPIGAIGVAADEASPVQLCNPGECGDACSEATPVDVRSRLSWRVFQDNACGQVDDAIRAVWGALAAGVIAERDAAELDQLLRGHQARFAPPADGTTRRDDTDP